MSVEKKKIVTSVAMLLVIFNADGGRLRTGINICKIILTIHLFMFILLMVCSVVFVVKER